MRFMDFLEDRRLMQEAGASAGGVSAAMNAEDQGLAAALANAPDSEKAAIIARWRALVIERATADKNAGVAGTSGAEAQKGVQTRGATGQQQNAEEAARNTTDLLKQNLAGLIKNFEQSVAGLMATEQSVEQMKAGFSGMLKVLGIVCKKLGAEDFGQGCLELADDLKPELVEPSPEGLRRIRELEEQLKVNPAPGAAIISDGQDRGAAAADKGQTRVEDAAREGAGVAGSMPQPSALNGSSGSAARGSAGITAAKLDEAMSPLMTGNNPALRGSQAAALQEKRGTFASQGGDPNAIDTATEKASMAAAIRMQVTDQGAENRLLGSLGLLNQATKTAAAAAPAEPTRVAAAAPRTPEPA